MKLTVFIIVLSFGCCFNQYIGRRRFDYNPLTRRTSSRARLSLTCGEFMTVKIDFAYPFRGLAYVGKGHNKCVLRGDGKRAYTMKIPLNDCGTKQNCPPGSFTNLLSIQYEPNLTRGEDESHSIRCKYGLPRRYY
ncbi:uncharacterized protein [Centruroides vittatus]|uniref:uncharacterized protein n=1 Tax=Centruroides vittatus TaxID=120091 RepID=UPI00350F21EC